MPFTLDISRVHSILDPAAEGDWAPFAAAIDPDVHWFIGDDKHDSLLKTGIYNFQRWKDEVNVPLLERLEG